MQYVCFDTWAKRIFSWFVVHSFGPYRSHESIHSLNYHFLLIFYNRVESWRFLSVYWVIRFEFWFNENVRNVIQNRVKWMLAVFIISQLSIFKIISGSCEFFIKIKDVQLDPMNGEFSLEMKFSYFISSFTSIFAQHSTYISFSTWFISGILLLYSYNVWSFCILKIIKHFMCFYWLCSNFFRVTKMHIIQLIDDVLWKNLFNLSSTLCT